MLASPMPRCPDNSLSADHCPRFDFCNAPICPLDDKWKQAQHLKGESVCGLLSELVKPGGLELLHSRLPINLINKLEGEYKQIIGRWGVIRTRLKQAARSGSKIQIGLALAEKARATATETRLSDHAGVDVEAQEPAAVPRCDPFESL